jgi:DNA-binding response OmpR family regulator
MNENYTVLVIDDVEENREILKRRLVKAGYRVETATEGREGLGLLRNTLVDVVLLDINMPIMDGMTVLKALRQDQTLSRIPVIMLTALDDTKTAMQCLKTGACGYVTKPFNMDQVTQQIRNCLAQQTGA